MNAIISRVTGLCALLAATVLLVSGTGPVQAQEKITLKYATFAPAQGFTNSQIIIPFLDRVVADSEGTIDYKVYSGGTLGRNPAEQLKLVQDGVADLAFVIPSYTPGSFEIFNVSQLPTLADTTKQASTGLWKLYEKGLLKHPDGVEIVGIFTTAPNVLHLNQEIKGIGDLQAMKIRVAGSVQNDVAMALGATPVGNIRAPETAEAISRGIVNGTPMDWIAAKSFKVDRVAQYHLDYPLGFVAIMIPINQRTWDSLPEPARKAFLKHGRAAFAVAAGEAFDKAASEARQAAVSAADQTVLEVNDADRAELQTRFGAIVEAWAKKSQEHAAAVDIFRNAD